MELCILILSCLSLVLVSQVPISDGRFQEHNIRYTKLLQNPLDNYSCLIVEQELLSKYKGFETNDPNEIKIISKSAKKSSDDPTLELRDPSRIYEIYSKSDQVQDAHIQSLCKSQSKPRIQREVKGKQNEPEIVKIVDSGNQSNRIDVVFMGDGYTLDERQEFFDDIRRLTKDMFEGVTFRSYLPLFNIWAIFVPSVDSGIGYNGPKNTPFRLYREQGQLRVIWPGNEAYAREICRLTGPSGCDYPSLIGNDDFYGGLGGEFVISTRSNRTGNVVLRHEMGHNFAAVGDEYDNSYAYWGVNSAKTLESVGWGAWLTSGSTLREERAMYRLLEYPWFDLSRGNQSFTFTSDGNYNRWYLLLSVSAAGEEDSLEFLLDGEILPWTSRGFDDREFYDWHGTQGFTPGQHVFSIRSKTQPTHPDIPRMICSITLHELGNENEFHQDNAIVSAYPTWDDKKAKTLRPTNGACLMRNITHNEFCSICKEGIWYEFLQKISIIDGMDIAEIANPDGTKSVTLNTLKLGQMREEGNEVEGERLEIRWFKGEEHQSQFDDQFQINAQVGAWRVNLDFKTPEVRVDPQGLLKEQLNFVIWE